MMAGTARLRIAAVVAASTCLVAFAGLAGAASVEEAPSEAGLEGLAAAARATTDAGQTASLAAPHAVIESSHRVDIGNLFVFGDSYSRLKRKRFPNWPSSCRAVITPAICAALPSAVRRPTAPPRFRSPARSTTGAIPASRSAPATPPSSISAITTSTAPRPPSIRRAPATIAACRRSWARVRTAAAARSTSSCRTTGAARRPTTAPARPGTFGPRPSSGTPSSRACRAGTRTPVAVDLFTPIDRVLAHPGQYGFKNVKTADPGHSATTALYDDDYHFGQHGQRIIEQTMLNYMSRSAEYVNGLAMTGRLQSRRQEDVASGLSGVWRLSTRRSSRWAWLHSRSVSRRCRRRCRTATRAGRSSPRPSTRTTATAAPASTTRSPTHDVRDDVLELR